MLNVRNKQIVGVRKHKIKCRKYHIKTENIVFIKAYVHFINYDLSYE